MRITFYGTRGSCPIAREDSTHYGGNTTCVRVESDCLPQGSWLLIDAGTGIRPACDDFCREDGTSLLLLQTHYHHDHTQGFALSGFPHMGTPIDIYGPREHDIGPREVYETLMKPPLFPVDLREVGYNVRGYGIELPNSKVLVIHPVGGRKLMDRQQFKRLVAEKQQIPFRQGVKFNREECIEVHMYRSFHPEETISYRFVENPTGKVFVFLTDHENQDGIPKRLREHLREADLLVMDCQYTDEKYHTQTAGWGHATPTYVARVACASKVRQLGLTHHDPSSSDDLVDKIIRDAEDAAEDAGNKLISIFGCHDHQVVDV